jgi:hypothetical protein
MLIAIGGNPSVLRGGSVIPEESLACGRAGLLKFKLGPRMKKDSSRMTCLVRSSLNPLKGEILHKQSKFCNDSEAK